MDRGGSIAIDTIFLAFSEGFLWGGLWTSKFKENFTIMKRKPDEKRCRKYKCETMAKADALWKEKEHEKDKGSGRKS